LLCGVIQSIIYLNIILKMSKTTKPSISGNMVLHKAGDTPVSRVIQDEWVLSRGIDILDDDWYYIAYTKI